MKFKTSDIPQADSLSLVRSVVDAFASLRDPTAKAVAERTGFSERHVRYRLQAARILGLIDADKLTHRGRRLLETSVGSDAEKNQFRRVVRECTVVQELAPTILSGESFDAKEVAKRITRMSGLAPATAERRAVALRAWQRHLV